MEDNCSINSPEASHDPAGLEKVARHDPTKAALLQRPECSKDFGSWMTVKKPVRKKNPKPNSSSSKEKLRPNRSQPELQELGRPTGVEQ